MFSLVRQEMDESEKVGMSSSQSSLCASQTRINRTSPDARRSPFCCCQSVTSPEPTGENVSAGAQKRKTAVPFSTGAKSTNARHDVTRSTLRLLDASRQKRTTPSSARGERRKNTLKETRRTGSSH